MELKQQLSNDYAIKLKVIESKTKEIWEKGELYHTYYTLHGIKHSDAVINILDRLVTGLSDEEKLNETEIFCLLSSAYLHDVGMQCKYPDDEAKIENISKLKNKPYTIQDLIRDEHHLRSGRYIKENLKDLCLHQYEAECVRLISEGHRKANLISNDYESQVIGFERIRVRLLSSLLRLADELDIDYRRAPETLYKILEVNMPNYSRLQWLKHYYTTGVMIVPTTIENKKRLSIEINCQYPREDEGRKITEVLVLKPIEEKVIELKTIFLEYGLKVDLTHKVKINTDLSEIPEDLYKDDFGQKLKVSIELPRTKGFVSRDDKLNELLNSLDRNVIVIEGIPGIGKTYISAKFAEKLKDKFDVYWYGNLSEASTLSSVLRKFAYILKEKNKPRLANSIEHFGYDNEVLITLLKEELNSSSFAIFLDDYHKAEKELNPLLRELLFIEKSKIIVVTRYEPKFYNSVDNIEKRVTTVQIDAWSSENTKTMLEMRGIETSESVSREIHERLHGHPQYLNLFCTLASNDTAEELLRNIPKALREAYNYLETEVYNSLSSSEKMLLQTIAVFRIPETLEAFDSVNEFKDLHETLDKLINKLLINEIGSNTFKIHDIIRDYCLSDSRKKPLRRYHENAANYYLSLDNEPENILEAAYHFEKAGVSEKSSKILIINSNNFIAKGFWDKIEVQLNNSIKLFQRKSEPKIIDLVALAHCSIGSLYEAKEEYDIALSHANQAKFLFNKVKDRNNICYAYNLLCSIYRHKKDIEKATECNEKCFHIAESLKDDYLKAVAIGNRALLLKKKDSELQLKYSKETLEIFEQSGKLDNVAETCVNISSAYSNLENFEKAYEYIKKALQIQKERNVFYEIANTKVGIAKICFKDPNRSISYDQIIKCLEDVIETYEKIGHKRGVADTLSFMGIVHVRNKNFQLGIECYQKAKELHSSLNQNLEKLKLEISLSEVLLSAGDPKEAIKTVSKVIESNTEENFLNKYLKTLAVFIEAISFTLLDKNNQSNQLLEQIGNLNDEELTDEEFEDDWDFSDIKSVLTETGKNKQLFLDIIKFLENKTSFLIIRPEDIQILEEEKGLQTKVYHPFVGFLTISATDDELVKLIQQLTQSQIINFDMSNILNLERKRALSMLGFLSKKGICKIKCLEDQKYKLDLTKKGLELQKNIIASL